MSADLIGTILVGPKEKGLATALQGLQACGCEAIYALVDLLDQRSMKLLDKYNCAVIQREWDWDFGSARNRLQEAIPEGTRWQIFLDSDDEIPPQTSKRIKELIQNSEPKVYMLPYVYMDNGIETQRIKRDRLFPPKGVVWKARAHEYPVFPPGLPKQICPDMPIIHHWAKDRGDRANRYIEVLQKDLKDEPNNARTMHYLAQSLKDAGQSEAAIEMYERYLATGGWPEERMVACIYLSYLYQRQKNLDKALEYAIQSNAEVPDRRECCQRIAEIYYLKKDWQNAYDWLEKEIILDYPKDALVYVRADHYKERPYLYLPKICHELGKIDEALLYTQKALEYKPDDEMSLNNLKWFKSRGLKENIVKRFKSDKPTAYFYVGQSCEKWTADSVNTTGIGGRETSNIHMAKEMQRLGWNVVLFPDCQGMDGAYDGILHVDYREFHDICKSKKPDVVFSSIRTSLVDRDFPAKMRIMWIHDIGFGESLKEWPDYLTTERRDKFDKFFFMSQSQMDYIVPKYGIPSSKTYLTRSGIKVDRFQGEVQRERNRLMYTSSHDRGLERLLDFWPEIKDSVPDAELRVYYGFLNAIVIAKGKSEEASNKMTQWIQSLKDRIERLPGVHLHDRIPQDQLALEFQKSSVWAYPTHFWETMCLSALEASAAGCAVVTSPLAALNTTVGEYGILVQGGAESDQYRKDFVDNVVRLLTDDEYWTFWSEKAKLNIYDRFNEFGTCYWDWTAIAQEWEVYLRKELGLDRGPVVELGSGESPSGGENTIHTDAREGLEHIECITDINELPFRSGSLGKVVAHQVLEHTSWRKTLDVLNQIWDKLRPGGVLEVGVPDFYVWTKSFFEGQNHIYNMSQSIFASQGCPENFHKAAFLPSSLRSFLARAGFQVTDMCVRGAANIATAMKPDHLDKHEFCKLAGERFQQEVRYPQSLYGLPGNWNIEEFNRQVFRKYVIDDPELSIVVIASGQKDTRTIPCIESVRENVGNIKYELIGVDDGSEDGTFEFLKENADTAISIHPRQGISVADNVGISLAKAPCICFMDNDVNLPKGLIGTMLDNLKRHKNCGMMTGWHTSGFRGRGKPKDTFTLLPSALGKEWAWDVPPPGPCRMHRKETLVRVGLFDPFLYNNWIDHDILVNVLSHGYDVGIVTEPEFSTFPADSTLNEGVTYTKAQHIRRFLSLYYFHLKWDYRLDYSRLLTVNV